MGLKQSDIVVGGIYVAKVGNNITTVRVDAIRQIPGSVSTSYGVRTQKAFTAYDVTNLKTQRTTTFRSAAKFRSKIANKTSAGWPQPGFAPGTVELGKVVTKDNGNGTSDVTTSMTVHPQPEGEAFPDTDATNEAALAAAEAGDFDKADQLLRNDELGQVLTRAGQLEGEQSLPPQPAPTVEAATLVSSEPQTAQPVEEPVVACELSSALVDAPSADASVPASAEPAEPYIVPPATLSIGSKNGGAHRNRPSLLTSQLAPIIATPSTRKYALTDEQQMILDAAPHHQVLVIEAGAGAGKTSTEVELANALHGRGQYTAFNTALVAESKDKLPSHCPANTIHSLAFRSEGTKFAHRLNAKQRTRSSELAAILGIREMVLSGPDGKDKRLDSAMLATQVMRAIKSFCQSADREVVAGHFARMSGLDVSDSRPNEHRVREYLLPFAVKAWEDLSNPLGTLPYQHDFYVKCWELNHPSISADYILVDESQDLSFVMLSIMQKQVAIGTRIILVGDSNQAIYGWRGCTNALGAFPDAKRLFLSQSFRFGPAVASVANAVLKNLEVKSQLVMRGLQSVPSRLEPLVKPRAILCRTNAGAISHLLQAIAANRTAHMVGGGADALAFVEAAEDLQRGRRTSHPDLCCFDNWQEVVAFSKTEEGEDLKLMTKLVTDFGASKIVAALKRMPEERAADLIISTVHRSKGREWDTVKLAADFKTVDKMGDEELRLLYVAATRAKLMLDVESCPPFCGNRSANDEECGDAEDDFGKPEAEKRRSRVPTIDISEARRISAATERQPEQVAPAAASAPAVNGDDKPEDIYAKFTWAKGKSGGWAVRGRPGMSGKEVQVYRRNGSCSREVLGKQVWVDEKINGAMYETK